MGSERAAITLVVAVAVAVAWASTGGVRDVVRSRRRDGRRPIDGRVARVGGVVVAVGAIAAAAVAPVVGVFWALVALNHLFGRGEHVPFSTYPMFASPGRAWTIRFEGTDGTSVALVGSAIAPHVARKRFQTVASAALAGGDATDLVAAREAAAADLVAWIGDERHRLGPLASEPIAVVLLEFDFEGSEITTSRTVLGVSAPA